MLLSHSNHDPRQTTPDTAGVIAITVTSLLWGTTGTAATFAPTAGPLAIGAAALGIGGLLQAVIAIRSLRSSRRQLARHRRLVAFGGISVCIYPLAFYSSMHLAGVAIGTVVSLASAPLASGILERIIEGRRLSTRWIIAAVTGVIGAAMLCLSRVNNPVASVSSSIWGIGLGLIAGFTYASYSWASRRLMGAGVPRDASMGAIFGLGGLLLMPVLLVTGQPLVTSRQAFLVACYMAIVPMFIGYLLFGFGLSRVPASTATTITLLEPAVAAVLAVLVVGERLAAMGWCGLGLIAIALVILVWPGKARSR